ncbi:C25 family cysteine peptidase [Williamwhitmania taraxaci]|uniref:Por secretion system C-terminal sorting domain-containing protein n=1 Tax=Williamwhitmania taraxaci TaxID=1640674 RepID=A0A1G6IBU3_9BACT|nr:C25 family cysteine peptidase [Williamwhitmania taraxaci]SDC04012.1 Por secretion system C-terminal sorting domain-containing protein [Williamwhitmania taraxaci]
MIKRFTRVSAMAMMALGFIQPLAAQVRLQSSTGNAISVDFKMEAYGHTTVSTSQGEAFLYTFEHAARLQEKGAPDLPKYTRSVIIPDNAKMVMEVIPGEFEEFTNVLVAPSKGVITRDKDPQQIPFTFGKEYTENKFYPEELATLASPYIIRDFRGQAISFNPIQYNPVTKTVRIYKGITVKLIAKGNSTVNAIQRTASLSEVDGTFAPLYANHFLNYSSSRYTPIGETGGKMLIICPASYMDEIAPFVAWKNSIGIQTQVVDYATIGSAAALKTYVTNYYNQNGLTFLLLVGDNAQVPTSSTTAGDSDNNYGYIVGSDHYLDIFVGRFSAETEAQVTTQVNRTIYYERDLSASDASISKGVGIASNEGGTGGDDGESDEVHMGNIKTDLQGYGYTISNCYQNGGSASSLSTLINNGTGIINYVGHGSNTSWASMVYTSANVSALTNVNKYPFIISVACVVGNFKSLTCFAETWLRATYNNQPTGALVFCGSTINQSWASPMCAQDKMNDLLVANTYKLYGGMFVNGMFQMIDEYSTDGMNMADTWTIFGDPSVYMRTPSHPNGPTATTSCGVPANLVASNVAQTSATLTWGAVTSASSYGLRYKLSSATTWVDVASLTATSYNLSGLTANSTYDFQVKTTCASGTSAYSATKQFTTTASASCGVPASLAASNIAQTSANLTWGAVTSATSYALRYKLSTATAWTSVASITATSYSLSGLTASSIYDFQVSATCASGTSAYSATTQFTTLSAGGSYCAVGSTRFSYEWIAKVAMNTFTNSSAGSAYTDYTSKIIALATGSNTVTLTPGFASSAYSEYWAVYIDYNNDYDFDDSGELVFSGNGTAAVTGTITVPTSATGSTRLRVVMKYNAAPAACGTSYGDGEAEDYTVTFSGTTPPLPTTYCTSKGNSSTDEWISKVVIGSFQNVSTASGYTDFSAKTVSVTAGQSYAVTLTPSFSGSAYSEFWKVWIDINGDGDFTDSGEELFSNSGSAAVSGTITIPANLALNTRMRISMKYNAAPTACESFSYGEVEDYTVAITRGSGRQEFTDPVTETSILSIFPNPASTTATLQLNDSYLGDVQLMVIAMDGKVVYSQQEAKPDNAFEICLPVTQLAKGTYSVVVFEGAKKISKRLIVE